METYPQRENIAMISEFLKNEKTQSSEIEKSISTYQPEPHRLQKIGTIQNDGVLVTLKKSFYPEF